MRVSKRTRFTRLEWWLDGLPQKHWWWAIPAESVVKKVLDLWYGHMPVVDHCGKPEHDYCARCTKVLPGMAVRTNE